MSLTELLKTYDIDDQEAEIYQVLLSKDWVTVLQLSRLGNIKRPTLYRVLEKLVSKGLVEKRIEESTTLYKASGGAPFEAFVGEQEARVKQMKDLLPELKSQLSSISTLKTSETSVHFYQGIRGLQYMEYKRTQTPNTEVLIFGGERWAALLGENFAEEVRNRAVANKIYFRELENTGNAKPIKDDGSTKWTKNTTYTLKHYRHRVLSEKQLKISQEMYIFNDTVHLVGCRGTDIFGIEIIGAENAKFHKQIFENFWNQAKVIDKFGDKV